MKKTTIYFSELGYCEPNAHLCGIRGLMLTSDGIKVYFPKQASRSSSTFLANLFRLGGMRAFHQFDSESFDVVFIASEDVQSYLRRSSNLCQDDDQMMEQLSGFRVVPFIFKVFSDGLGRVSAMARTELMKLNVHKALNTCLAPVCDSSLSAAKYVLGRVSNTRAFAKPTFMGADSDYFYYTSGSNRRVKFRRLDSCGNLEVSYNGFFWVPAFVTYDETIPSSRSSS